MRMRSIGAAAVAAMLAVTGRGGGAEAADQATPGHVWARQGADEAAMRKDLGECVGAAQNLRGKTVGVYTGSFLVDVLETLVATQVADGARRPPARAAFAHRCMAMRGYHAVALSVDEVADLRTRTAADDQAAWVRALYARPDFAGRLEAASKGPPLPLPGSAPEPLTYGAVRFDPAKLSAPGGTIAVGKAVLGGRIAHRRTARLTAAVAFHAGNLWTVDAGHPFYQLVADGEGGAPRVSYWCSTMVEHQPLTKAEQPLCGWAGDGGYAVYPATGQMDWLTPAPDFERPVAYDMDQPLALQPTDEDLVGAMDFTLILRRIDGGSAVLEAHAGMDGDRLTFWRGQVAFGADDRAVLPFWTHRLVLTRAGSGVTAAFTADGDGQGWPAG